MSASPLVAVLRRSTILTLLGLVVGGGGGLLIAGSAGLTGALLGIAIPSVFFGTTLAVALLTGRTAGPALGAVVLGSWLVKLVVLVVVLAVLKPLTFYDRPVFGVALLGWTAVLLGLEVRVIKNTRQLYVEPQ